MFLVKEYPKDRHYRRPRLSAAVIDRIKTHVTDHGLGPDDLIFTYPTPPPVPIPEPQVAATLGLTEPNDQGCQYRHGSLSGYPAGRCRCPHSRRAYATYRATRRHAGTDHPRPSDGGRPTGTFHAADSATRSSNQR